jgi:hypothetical protein
MLLSRAGMRVLLLDPIRTRRRERRVLRSSTISVRRDEIDAREFARSCESTYRPVWWVCGSVGQMRPPLTVVGALVGGRAGQLSATVIARGLQVAVAAAKEDVIALFPQRLSIMVPAGTVPHAGRAG